MHPKFKNLPYRSNVGIMLINDDGHVFVGQRLDNNQNAWQMPQGGVDDEALDGMSARFFPNPPCVGYSF